MNKHSQPFPRLALWSALFFLTVSAAWIWVTHYFVKPGLTNEILLVVAIAFVVFLIVRASNRRFAAMNREYRGLFEKHPNPMWIFDRKSLKFLAVNEAAIKQYGYTQKEFLRLNMFDIRPAEDHDDIRKYLSDPTPRAQHQTIWRHFKKDGTQITVKVVSSDVTFRGHPARLAELNDLTAEMNQQERIREMSLVAENTTNGVLFSDAEGRIKWVNRAFEQTTGYLLHEVQGKFPRSFLHGPLTDKVVEKTINDLVQRQQSFTGDLVNYKKDGSPYWVHLNLCPIVVDGKTENIVVIQTDVTELKQQSEKIEDQYRRLREMAFMTSHNMRSQVTNIMSLCDIINDPHCDADAKELAGYLKESAVKLDLVIHNIVGQTVNLD